MGLKKSLLGLMGTFCVMGMCSTSAMASPMPQMSPAPYALADGYPIHLPGSVTLHGETYLPLWYLIHDLQRAGISSHWEAGSWVIHLPGLQLQPIGKLAVAGVPVVVNGTTIAILPGMNQVDPFSHKTTFFVNVTDMDRVVQALGWQVSFNGSQWQADSPSLQSLKIALTDTSSSPFYQANAIEHLYMQTQLTQTAINDLKSAQQSMPTSENLTMQTKMEVGKVAGQRAELAEVTTQMQDSTIPPESSEVYIQGNHLYERMLNSSGSAQGQGQWMESTISEKLLKLEENPELGADLSLSMLRNIHITASSGDTTTYAAQLDTNSLERYMSLLFSESGLSGLAGQENLSSSQMLYLLNHILQTTKMQLHLTVSGHGDNAKLSKETAQMSFSITPHMFGKNLGQQMAAYIKQIEANIDLRLTYTYNNTPVTPPSDLPQNESSTTGVTYGSGQ